MTSPKWTSTPAIGEIIVRLMTIRARMLRLEAARRLQSIAKTIDLVRG